MEEHHDVVERRRHEFAGRPLPRQQQRAFDFICAELADGRPFPSRKAMREHMGWKNESGVLDVLAALRRKRKIRMRPDGTHELETAP